ncbi:hypothetical protein ACFYVL_40625 [Streptomyces sp. NPDC004111]|uniref:hypothetical protein n=1 Tax=Streptomyces sp. NPDC004111 TaxID=3364690 RepID=UPI003697F3A0
MAAPHRPTYPPRTEPPPKRPLPPPDPPPKKTAESWMQTRIADRRSRNWPVESRPWTPGKAGGLVVDALNGWGYRFDTDTVNAVVRLLVTAAVDDGGDHLSVHLADHHDHAMVLVLSSGPHTERPGDRDLLAAVARQGAADCGVESAEDGRRRWALINLVPPLPTARALPDRSPAPV